MKLFTADPRDGSLGAACSTCCCQTIVMRPGETDLVVLNYAAWAVPMGSGIQLVGQPDIQINRDDAACSQSSIDGFSPPAHAHSTFITPQGAATEIVLNDPADESPAGNSFSYRVHPNEGPRHGGISPYGADFIAGVFQYQPAPGFAGTDVVWFDMKDAQGRIYTFPVQMRVSNSSPTNVARLGAWVDLQKAIINQRLFEVSFPLTLSPDAKACEVFRMSLRQQARDCEGRLFTHYSCFDITAGKC